MTGSLSTKRIQIAVLSIFAILSVSAVQGSVQVGDLIRMGDGVGTHGGVFHVDDINDGPGFDFDTFCVELQQYINPNNSTKYLVESITTQNSLGNQLQPFAAWLYNSFLNKTLSGVNFSALTTLDANTIQLGIWRGMGYQDSFIHSVVGNSFYSPASTNLANNGWTADFANSGWSGLGNIRIMNLRTVSLHRGVYRPDGFAQDQLVRLPEPMSIISWATLLSLATGAYRFRKRRPALA